MKTEARIPTHEILTQHLNDDLNTEIGMALWLKRLSSLRLSALELACTELQDRGCEPLQADDRKHPV